MKLKEIYEKIYSRVFSVPLFGKLLKIPGVEKLLQYEIISYLVFGLMTTVVNFVILWGMTKIGGADYDEKVLFSVGSFDFLYIYSANAVAWFGAVLFSFFTNKLFVFGSKSMNAGVALKEMASFFGARIISFLIFEELIFGILLKILPDGKYTLWIVKCIVGVLVVIFNYFASKFFIFGKKAPEESEK